MTTKELFLRQLDCLQRDDREAQLALYSQDCIYEFPFANDRPRYIAGRDEIRRVMMPLWEDARRRGTRIACCDHSIIESIDPELIVAEMTLGIEVGDTTAALSVVQILRVRDGQIVHLREYFSPAMRAEVLK